MLERLINVNVLWRGEFTAIIFLTQRYCEAKAGINTVKLRFYAWQLHEDSTTLNQKWMENRELAYKSEANGERIKVK